MRSSVLGAVFLAAVTATSMPVTSTAQNAPEIYCNVVTSKDNATPVGIYKFTPGSDLTLEAVKVDENIKGTNGAVWAGDRYEIVNMMSHRTFDTATWEEIHSCQLGWPAFMEMGAMAVTYDPSDKKVYGCYLTTSQSYRFAIADYATATLTEIKDLGGDVWAKCMFADDKGVLYAIMNNGDLVTVDKTNGATTVIGNIDYETTGNTGAVYNPATGTAYWTVTVSGTPSLYELDLTDASTTLVAEFPGGEEFTGLFIEAGAVSTDGVPATAEDIALGFVEGALKGTLSFTAPAADTEGNPLSGELTYTVKLDEADALTGTAQPGDKVTTEPIEVAQTGDHLFAVIFANAAGTGNAAYKRAWIGFDKPEAPANVKLTSAQGKITLSWTAPAKGLNEGWFDAQNIKYDVVRYPDGVKVADKISETTFAETLQDVTIANYYYGITAFNGSEASDEAMSTKVKFGSYILPPYNQNFGTEGSLDFYTVIDVNKDGKTWGLNSWNMIPEYFANQSDNDADDWLVTPQVKLNKNSIYTISVVASGAESDFYDQNLKVMIGSGNTADELTTELVERTRLSDKPSKLKAVFTVEEDGLYYFGLHTATPAHQGWVNLTGLHIEATGTIDGPEAAKNLTVEAGEKGALEASVKFTAPAADTKGNQLTALEKIELVRDEQVINSWTAPQTGAALSYTDTEVTTGLHRYEVIAYNEKGAGYPAVASVYVGVDVPAPVENVVLAVDGGKATISWTPAAKGVNGGYVDNASLKYFVQRSDGAVVARNAAATTITDNPEKYEHQYELMYAVMAVSEQGTSQLAISNSLLFGDDYELPFTESFRGGATQNFWSLKNLRGGSFMLNDSFAVDGDGGSVAYQGNGSDSEAEIATGRIDMSLANAPRLTFYAPLNSGAVQLSVLVITPDNERHLVKSYDLNKPGEYNPVALSLADYTEVDNVRVVFNAKSSLEGTIMFLDAINIAEDTGVNDVAASDGLSVMVESHDVIVEAACGVPVAIFNVAGMEVAGFESTGHDTVTLPGGLYVVKAGNQTCKIAVR